MIELAKKKINLKKLKKKVDVQFKTSDILKIKKLKNQTYFYQFFFPFINLKNREKIVKQIYKSLNTGGGFILVEKLDQKILILKIF